MFLRLTDSTCGCQAGSFVWLVRDRFSFSLASPSPQGRSRAGRREGCRSSTSRPLVALSRYSTLYEQYALARDGRHVGAREGLRPPTSGDKSHLVRACVPCNAKARAIPVRLRGAEAWLTSTGRPKTQPSAGNSGRGTSPGDDACCRMIVAACCFLDTLHVPVLNARCRCARYDR